MSDFADVRADVTGRGALIGMAASTVSSATASVKIGDVTVTCSVARGLTLAVGDPVLVQRAGSKYVVTSVLQASAPSSPEDPEQSPAPNPPSVTGVTVINPVETRTYRNGSWFNTGDDSVYQGAYGNFGLNTGAVFYGDKPASLDGATVLSASVAVRRIKAGTYATQTPTLYLIVEKTRPAGAPTTAASMAGPALAVNETDTAFSIPAAWGQSIVNGVYGGFALYDADGDPYVRFAGRGDWGGAWSLRIVWTR